MATFYLVVDELVPHRGCQFRVRMWRQAGLPPLVLCSQVPGHPPPSVCSSFLANLTLRNFLGYCLPIPVFFELSEWKQQTRAWRVRFARRRMTPIVWRNHGIHGGLACEPCISASSSVGVCFAFTPASPIHQREPPSKPVSSDCCALSCARAAIIVWWSFF